MKKATLLTLAAALVLTLAACGMNASEPKEAPEPPASSPITSEEPIAEAKPIRAEVLSYSDLSSAHINLFGDIAEQFSSDIQAGTLNADIKWTVEDYIATGELPSNAVELFDQYCKEMGLQGETGTGGADTPSSTPTQSQLPSSSGEDEFHIPTPEEVRQQDISAGSDGNGSGEDWSLWDDNQSTPEDESTGGFLYEGRFPTAEEQRQQDISAGATHPGGTIDWDNGLWDDTVSSDDTNTDYE